MEKRTIHSFKRLSPKSPTASKKRSSKHPLVYSKSKIQFFFFGIKSVSKNKYSHRHRSHRSECRRLIKSHTVYRLYRIYVVLPRHSSKMWKTSMAFLRINPCP